MAKRMRAAVCRILQTIPEEVTVSVELEGEEATASCEEQAASGFGIEEAEVVMRQGGGRDDGALSE